MVFNRHRNSCSIVAGPSSSILWWGKRWERWPAFSFYQHWATLLIKRRAKNSAEGYSLLSTGFGQSWVTHHRPSQLTTGQRALSSLTQTDTRKMDNIPSGVSGYNFCCFSCFISFKVRVLSPRSSAIDQKTKEKVAIKKLYRPFQSLIHTKRAYRELRLLRHIQHENVRTFSLFFLSSCRE